jgi:HAD superfamily hydrolase (TIGR01509 family)
MTASSSPSFRGVLFDLDGVIIHSEPLHEEAMRTVFRKMDLAVPESRYREFKGTSERDTFQLVAREYSNGRFQGPEIHAAKQEIYEKGLTGVSLIRGFREYAEKLRELEIPAAVVTSATRYNCNLVLTILGIGDLFTSTLSADEVTRAKPDPEPYITGAFHLGLDPRDCLVIEDAERGAESALAAGCQVAGLATTLDKEDLRKAGCLWTANDYPELVETMGWPS